MIRFITLIVLYMIEITKQSTIESNISNKSINKRN